MGIVKKLAAKIFCTYRVRPEIPRDLNDQGSRLRDTLVFHVPMKLSQARLLPFQEIEDLFSKMIDNGRNTSIFIFDGEYPEGNYFIVKPFQVNSQFINLSKNPIDNIAFITRLIIRGNDDDKLKFPELHHCSKNHFLKLTCGKASLFVQKIATGIGILTRIIGFFSTRAKNHYNDAHVVIEVKQGKHWVMYDVDKKCYFKLFGNYLNALEFHEAIYDNNENIEIEFTDIFPKVDFHFRDTTYGTGYSYDFFEYGISLNVKLLIKEFYKRVCEVIYYPKDDLFYGYSHVVEFPLNRKIIKRLTREELIRLYYG